LIRTITLVLETLEEPGEATPTILGSLVVMLGAVVMLGVPVTMARLVLGLIPPMFLPLSLGKFLACHEDTYQQATMGLLDQLILEF
jgi:cytochrome c-type biogenesis protein CcmH/NrfF